MSFIFPLPLHFTHWVGTKQGTQISKKKWSWKIWNTFGLKIHHLSIQISNLCPKTHKVSMAAKFPYWPNIYGEMVVDNAKHHHNPSTGDFCRSCIEQQLTPKLFDIHYNKYFWKVALRHNFQKCQFEHFPILSSDHIAFLAKFSLRTGFLKQL